MKRILLVTCLGLLVLQAASVAGTQPQTQTFEEAFKAGDLALSNGQYTEAIQHYRRALASHPQHAQARFQLATAYREASRYYEARRNFRLALNANARDRAWESQCRLQIAGCWEATHHYREALAEYRLALAADASSDQAKSGQKRTVALVHGPVNHSK